MSSRSRATAALAALALIAGCGGDDDPPVVTVPADPFTTEAGQGVKPVEGEFTLDQVIRAYDREIGLPLRVDERVPGQYVVLTTLPGPSFAPVAPDLGLFSVYVADDSREAEALVGHEGLAEEQAGPHEPGVRFVAEPVLISAKARFGNVVLDWNADEEARTDERFQRLAAPLESLGGVPPPNRPAMNECVQDQGTGRLSAASGDATCRLGPQVITFASSDEHLNFGGLDVSLDGEPELVEALENQREDLSVGPDPPKPPQTIRSRRGEFLIVRLSIENRGDEPVESLRSALLLGDRLYRADLDDAFYVDRTNSPFPLDPGDSGTEVLLFDLPFRVARRMPPSDPEGASLVLVDPRDPHSIHVPASAPTVARLRLFD